MFYWNMLFEITFNGTNDKWNIVLILVLLEYALWANHSSAKTPLGMVLILVLLEYALWEFNKVRIIHESTRLNPCFIGICSLRNQKEQLKAEYELVLILVLLEYALWVDTENVLGITSDSLNPCFIGICSLSMGGKRLDHLSSERRNPCFIGICSLSATGLFL